MQTPPRFLKPNTVHIYYLDQARDIEEGNDTPPHLGDEEAEQLEEDYLSIVHTLFRHL